MDRTRRVTFVCASLAVLGLDLGSATTLRAQAWVPPRGEGTVSFTYQNYDVAGHFDVAGHENTNGPTHTQAIITELDCGVTNTIGLLVSLPFIASKYTGPPSHFVGPFETFPGPLDDGAYHATFQDVRVEARRAFLTGPLAVAAFVGASFPTHQYETVGEAVPGRHRRDFQFGASASVPLDRVLPGAYVHMRYSYAAAERVQGFSYTRSNVDLEGGRAVSSRVAVRGLATWQIRHKGPTLAELADDWEHHDRFIASSYLNVGGGASVSLTRSADVYAVWAITVAGESGAHRARLLAIGTSWSIGGGFGGLSAPQARSSFTATRRCRWNPRATGCGT